MLARALSGLREDLVPGRRADWAMCGVLAAAVLTLAVFALLGSGWALRGLCVLAGGLVVGTLVFGAIKAMRRKWTVLLAVAILWATWLALAILSIFVPFLGWASPFFESGDSLFYAFIQGALITSLTMALIGWLRPEGERKTRSANQRSHLP